MLSKRVPVFGKDFPTGWTGKNKLSSGKKNFPRDWRLSASWGTIEDTTETSSRITTALYQIYWVSGWALISVPHYAERRQPLGQRM